MDKEMKYRFCAILVLFFVVVSAGAQMKSSHAPALPAANTAPSAKNVSMAPAMTVSGKPVAKVNGAVLTDRDLVREMYAIFPYAQQHNGFPKELEPQIRSGALQMIIFEELVYQDAKRRNMTVPPAKLTAAEGELRKQFPSQAAYQEFLKEEAMDLKRRCAKRSAARC